jgi:flagella basal body P-ring formation protein FlgA
MMLPLLLAIAACLPVEGDRILMGDLASALPAFSGLPADESIGFAPAPGAQRRFSPGELDRLAARKGIAVETEPVCFERKMEVLTEEKILDALRESLPDGAQLRLIEFSQGSVPKGALEFPRTGLTAARPGLPRGAVIWRGRVKYSARQSVSVWAKVAVWIARPSVMAIHDLPAGKPIQADQIRIETIDAGPFTGSMPVSKDEMAGLAPRRPIRAGQVISRAILEAPAEVTRGEMVGVEAHYGAAFLKSEARAEASGRVGDSVAVRNVESGRTFRAHVLRKGWVAVE